MQSPNEDATKAFATQYTSLILILLTFVLGAFSAPATQSEGKLTPQKPLPAFGSLHYKDILEHHDLDALEPLLLVLRSHDVKVRLILHVRELREGLEQLRHLREYLLFQGIPDDAVKFEVKKEEEKGIDVQFLTEET